MRTVEPAAWARQCAKQDDRQGWDSNLPPRALGQRPEDSQEWGIRRGNTHARTHPPRRRVGARPRRVRGPGHEALVPASPRCAWGRNPYGPWVPARSSGSPLPRARTWQQKQKQQRRSRERRELRGANTARVGAHSGSGHGPEAPRGRGGGRAGRSGAEESGAGGAVAKTDSRGQVRSAAAPLGVGPGPGALSPGCPTHRLGAAPPAPARFRSL